MVGIELGALLNAKLMPQVIDKVYMFNIVRVLTVASNLDSTTCRDVCRCDNQLKVRVEPSPRNVVLMKYA